MSFKAFTEDYGTHVLTNFDIIHFKTPPSFMLKKLLIAAGVCLSLAASAQNDIVTTNFGRLTSALTPVRFQGTDGANEFILLQSEIGAAGQILELAFEKIDGGATFVPDGITIRFKHTPNATMATGVYDSTGYVTVFSGTMNNSLASGWNMQTIVPFLYNGTDNLSILVERRGGTPVNLAQDGLRHAYGNITPNRNRRTSGNVVLTHGVTSLAASDVLPNTMLVINRGALSTPSLIGTGMVMYPNPASGTLHLKTDNPGMLTIRDAKGIAVRTSAVAEGQQTISLEGISSGVYMAELIANGQVTRKSLVVK